ncbi:hypothetical protein [Desulfotruncus alcoholivorax]|uniref:hypothetical protein n=1 Tax=Desulfotruncus alcoholivorax TaxID=265477 RepID=UPI0004052291|nr:hypothetical protein [Desulfotruncus alcoholivorax]
MNFTEYLYSLAHVIFKRKSKPEDTDIYKLASALGPGLDDLQESIFLLREQSLVTTTTGAALDLLGKDRKMPRYRGESDEEYRLRLLAAVEIYSETGTKPGMEKILTLLGYLDSEVYPLYLEKYKWRFLDSNTSLDGGITLEALDPTARLDYLNRWAEFLVKINLGEGSFMETQYLVTKQMINKVKPSESKIYALQFTLTARFVLPFKLSDWLNITGYFGNEFNPGIKLLDGRKTLAPNPFLFDLNGNFRLNGELNIDNFSGWADGTWYLADTRTRSEINLLQTANTSPNVILALDGRYWLNNKVAIGRNSHPITGRSLTNVSTFTDTKIRNLSLKTRFILSVSSPHPRQLLDAFYHGLGNDRGLDGQWYISANKHIDGAFILSFGHTRITDKINLLQTANTSPNVILALDGRYWLNNKVAIGRNSHPITGRSLIRPGALVGITIKNSQTNKMRLAAAAHSPHPLNFLDAYYHKLSGDRLLNSSWTMLASKLLNSGFQLSIGKVRIALASFKVGAGVIAGSNFDLSTGRWLLDGGNYKYRLDGFLKLSPRNWLDGSLLLKGGEKLCYRAGLSEKINTLSGRILWGGELLNGFRQLKTYPMRHNAGVKVMKDGRIIEQGVI